MLISLCYSVNSYFLGGGGGGDSGSKCLIEFCVIHLWPETHLISVFFDDSLSVNSRVAVTLKLLVKRLLCFSRRP